MNRLSHKTSTATSDPRGQGANEAVQKTINQVIRDRGEIGIQVAAYLDGDMVVDAWGGVADQSAGLAVDGDTLFPAFSVSKAITAVALHVQAEKGLVDYGMPVAHYWPEFGVYGKDQGTVYDVLTHRIGVPLVPADITPELMCNWDWIVSRIGNMRPLFEPGTKTAYLSLTFGWIIGEIVRRTDPKRREFGDFVQQEICEPLGIDALWFGIPDEVEARVATLTNAPGIEPGTSMRPPGTLLIAAIPATVETTQEVWGRSDVRRACIPAAGGIMNARSLARFYAMLAGGGQLDGVRLLSQERVQSFSVPRPPVFYDLTVGIPNTGSIAGFHLVANTADVPRPVHMAPAGPNPRTFGHPGFGGQIGWADPSAHLAVGILHNRMLAIQSASTEDDPIVAVANSIRTALDLPN